MQWGIIPRFHRAVCDKADRQVASGSKAVSLRTSKCFPACHRPHSASSDLGVIAAVLRDRARPLGRSGSCTICALKPQARQCNSKELLRALDRLDVMHPAPIPIGAEPAAARCGEMVEQVGHRVVRTMISSSRENAARQSHLLHATSMVSRFSSASR